MTTSIISHGSEAYQQMLQLRIRVLLNPIGIPNSYINTIKEKEDILIGAYENAELIGCCVLTPRENQSIQLRQMAVNTAYQGKGVGAAIVVFAEQIALEKGYNTLLMHARANVVEFYKKSGYTIASDVFEEINIEHYIMQKQLQ